MQNRIRRCRVPGCNNRSDKVGFVSGKNLCNPCNAAKARSKRNPDDVGGRPARKIAITLPTVQQPTTFDFGNRLALNQTLRREFESTAADLDYLVAVNKERMKSALSAGLATDIDKAENALAKAVNSKRDFNTTLLNKLELLEDLRDPEDSAGGKPITFKRVHRDRSQANIVQPAGVSRDSLDCSDL